MSIFSRFFSKKELIKARACPNCWGDQQYDNVVRDLINDKQLDVNNHKAKHAFIQDFVTNKVSGIHLQKEEGGFQCRRCQRLQVLEDT